VVITSFDGDDHYALSSDTDAFRVDADCVTPISGYQSTYTGALTFWTPTATSNTATLNLTATIKACEADPNVIPDVATATVTFINATTGQPIVGATNLKVGYVDPLDKTIGTATAIIQYSLGNLDIDHFTLAIKVGGYYQRQSASDYEIVTIVKPIQGKRIYGGGGVTSSRSTGTILSAPGQINTYGFDVTYTNKSTNPQGHAYVLINSYRTSTGAIDTKLHTYRVKSNAISTLTIDTGKGYSLFTSKSSIEELDPQTLAVIGTVDGGANLQISMYDGAISGTGDKVGISVYNSKTGGLWFSSDWSGVKTVEDAVTGNGAFILVS
jgi:hypothetical protein